MNIPYNVANVVQADERVPYTGGAGTIDGHVYAHVPDGHGVLTIPEKVHQVRHLGSLMIFFFCELVFASFVCCKLNSD